MGAGRQQETAEMRTEPSRQISYRRPPPVFVIIGGEEGMLGLIRLVYPKPKVK